jgi:hypothetical protein
LRATSATWEPVATPLGIDPLPFGIDAPPVGIDVLPPLQPAMRAALAAASTMINLVRTSDL